MVTLGDVPYITCAAIYFLNISADVFNAFRSSIPGDGKGYAGNGLYSASVSSMSDFISRYFYDNDGSWYSCGNNPLCHLRALLPYC